MTASRAIDPAGAESDGVDIHVIAAVISADKPLSADLVESVTALARRAEDASSDRPHGVVLYISGAQRDRSFAWPGDVAVGDVGKWETALRRLEQVPAPIVAVVSGDAYGPAAELLLVADYRVLRSGSVFAFAATESGVWPAMGLHRLVAQAGVGPARQLTVQGRSLSAERARDLGLIDTVIADGAEAETAAINAGLALFGSVAGSEVAIRRRLLLDAGTTRFEDALGAHLAASDRTLRRGRTAS
ncbi:enoyl-CoA-hydratase DpgB [Nocardia nepalensis]|uniref:enoyl-CoA-hydratase DpgB n=1 Tax=Nocardia nepalensis TaxID=3375448 RepID=UPI003B67004E